MLMEPAVSVYGVLAHLKLPRGHYDPNEPQENGQNFVSKLAWQRYTIPKKEDPQHFVVT